MDFGFVLLLSDQFTRTAHRHPVPPCGDRVRIHVITICAGGISNHLWKFPHPDYQDVQIKPNGVGGLVSRATVTFSMKTV